jgi:hypothetical protein
MENDNSYLRLRVLLQKQISTSDRRSIHDLVQSSPLVGWLVGSVREASELLPMPSAFGSSSQVLRARENRSRPTQTKHWIPSSGADHKGASRATATHLQLENPCRRHQRAAYSKFGGLKPGICQVSHIRIPGLGICIFS